VISSTQAAIDQGKNTFKSTTLTQNDIDNHASYDANSISVSAGTGGPLGGSAGVGHDSGNASSVTQSGISGIAGNRTARTGDAETGINKVFDATKVQSESGAQTQITQAFGSQASKAIGDYATAQEAKATALRLQAKASQTTDPEQYQSLMAQADQIDSKWGDQGTLRLGAHAIVGGLTGGISGAVGVTAGALTAPEVAKALTAAHITGPLASTLTALASTAVGVAAGGTAGGATAYNEVNNNYLTHQQQQDLLNKLSDKNCSSTCRDDAISAAKVLSAKQDADLKNCEFNGDQACISKAINEIFVAQNSPTSTKLTSYLGLQDAGLVNNSGTLINNSQIKASIDWLSYAKNSCQGMSSGQCAINYEQMKNGDIPALVRLKDGTKDNLIGGKTSGLMYYIKGVGYVAAEILIPTTPTDIALSLMPVGKLVGKLDTTIATGEKTLIDRVPLASCGGIACFVAGTLIQTDKGLKPIETFVGGEMVWARNDETLEYGYRPVVTTKATADQELYEVVVGNMQGQTETYYTTSEHPFWLKDHGWRKASLLEAGMTLLDRHNEPIQIISQSLTSDIDTVFNIQVQDSETYHIGELGIWVHNADCCPKVDATKYQGEMLGANGTQTASKTIWKGDGQARIDVENPAPGDRAGQVHYQDNAGNKYYYDPNTNSLFYKVGDTNISAPKSIQNLLNNPSFMNGINKGLKYLGVNK
jgi:filamentous hemagglutinin